MVSVARLEPMEPDGTCVWCWKEITNDQPSLKFREGEHAHLACVSRMLNFIEKSGESTE